MSIDPIQSRPLPVPPQQATTPRPVKENDHDRDDQPGGATKSTPSPTIGKIVDRDA